MKHLEDSEGAEEDPSDSSACHELSALSPFQKVVCSYN